MVTFKSVSGVVPVGSRETEHSWFPGYAWTIAYCRRCGQHLGWRFDAVEGGLSPRMFWGLRRPMLACRSPDLASRVRLGAVWANWGWGWRGRGEVEEEDDE